MATERRVLVLVRSWLWTLHTYEVRTSPVRETPTRSYYSYW